MVITEEILNQSGFIKNESVFKKDEYWCLTTKTNIIIPSGSTLKDIIDKVFNIGLNEGIAEGKEIRSEQIKIY